MHGIARGLNVPDETRTALICVADWLQRSGWSSCQPAQERVWDVEAQEFKAPEHKVEPHKDGAYRYRGYRVFTDGPVWAVDLSGTPERYMRFNTKEQVMEWLDKRIADESYTPYNKRTVPDDIIEDADLYGHKLCKDINGNWVLIPEED